MTTTTATKNKATASLTIDMRGIRPYKGRFRIERMHNGKRLSRYADTVSEALAVRDAVDAELKKGITDTETKKTAERKGKPRKVVKNDSWLLDEAIEVAYKRNWSHLRDRTHHTSRIKHLLEFYGEKTPLSEIDTDSMVEFRDWLQDEYSNAESTCNRKIHAISRILRTAFEHGKLDRMPVIPTVAENNERSRYITEEEEQETIEAFKKLAKPEHLDAFKVLIDTGFRTGELWGITAKNINRANNSISLRSTHTKTKKARTIIMTERVQKIIYRRVKETQEGDCLFPYTNSWFRYQWDRVREYLGRENDEDWVPHILRHTCCSRLVQRGVTLFVVREWMGHSSLQTTQRYAHFNTEFLQNAVDVLEK